MADPRRLAELREVLHRDALSAKQCRESAEEWRRNLPTEWIDAVPEREVDAICSYVWGKPSHCVELSINEDG